MSDEPAADAESGKLVAAYHLPRGKALALAACLGTGLGTFCAALKLEFIPGRTWDLLLSPGAGFVERVLPLTLFLGQLVGALACTVVLHEGVHGLVAVLCGCRPRFGVKLPMAYVTFDRKVPRGRFILVALAPLVLLDAAFGVLAWSGLWPRFFMLGLVVNTIGATGDLWMTFKLLAHARGSLVRDTLTGFEVWSR